MNEGSANRSPDPAASPSNAIWWFACLLWLGVLCANPMLGPSLKVNSDCPNPVLLEREPQAPVQISCSEADRAPLLTVAGALLFGQMLDLNAAPETDLTSLPGIGPTRAAEIIRTRCEWPFSAVEDVVRVPGIGPKTLEGLVGWVRVGAVQACASPFAPVSLPGVVH